MTATTCIAVIEDEAPIRRGVVDVLRASGYAVAEAADGACGLEEAKRPGIALVLLDLLLPRLDGLEVLRRLRQTRPALPVIILTARGTEDDRVRGLKMGADDYVVKPFSARELLARVEAVLRRAPGRPSEAAASARLGRAVIDFARREVRWSERERGELSETEGAILNYLVAHRMRAVSREELLQHVWGIDTAGLETRTVDMHIARLRVKLRDPSGRPGPEAVLTVRAQGYMAGPDLLPVAEPDLAGAPARLGNSTMRRIFRGKVGGAAVFLLVTGLVAGGLGWVTLAALHLEREQLQARADAEQTQKLHVALWRLDSRVAPALALEDNRPYNHYSAVFAPTIALRNDGTAWEHGAVIEPSPLLQAELPDWMRVHFQADEESGWESPQVPHGPLRRRLANPRAKVVICNDTDDRRLLLDELEKAVPSRVLLALVKERVSDAPTVNDLTLMPPANPADNNNNDVPSQQAPNSANPPFAMQSQGRSTRGEYQNRLDMKTQLQSEANTGNFNYKDDRDVALKTLRRSGASWFLSTPQQSAKSETVTVCVSPLMPLWVAAEGAEPRLLLARVVRLDDKEVCQGVALDWPRLRKVLTAQVTDIFPEADLRPVLPGIAAEAERTMSALPVQLVPAPAAALEVPAWTPLRISLALAWTAALVALLAVALGGWSLLNLSERRIRFVSAVTHELRTPLTTLRLYLDMLTGGLVKGEAQKAEYLQTLYAETERLNRLVGNVLDFSRLENQTPQLNKTTVTVAALLEGVREPWQGRCQGAGKELLVEATVPAETVLDTDVALAQQVLGNLLDNACKYSRGAADARLWLRARLEAGGLVLEVEDRGPGVAAGERRSIFRPFRRGQGVDVTAGGVGLGLALAERWAGLLGGRLTLCAVPAAGGACFRLELPLV